MNNKEKYIAAVDGISAPDGLKQKIAETAGKPVKKKPAYKAVAAIAACLAVVMIAVPALGGTFGAKMSADQAEMEAPSAYNGAPEQQLDKSISETGKSKSAADNRKIIKTASYDFDVKNLDTFLISLNASLTRFGGYISNEQRENYDYSRCSNLTVNVPSNELDAFCTELEALGTVTFKNTSASDVTDTYIDIQSMISALETEQKTLLGLLEKAENLQDTIQIQDRLTEVRGDLESYKSQLKAMEGQIEYAEVRICVNEEKRTVQSDGSFGSQVKEKFLTSIYNIADFFTEFSINFLGAIPYIAILAVVAVIVIIIVKKKKTKH